MDDIGLDFKLSRDCSVHIVFVGTVTQEAIQKMILLLTEEEDAYPSTTEKECSNEK
jgi:hypothetical protein